MTAVEAEKTDIVVIGAGISGLAAAKCLRESGFDVVVLERTDEVGGLWTFREKSSYGVMRFTHINVSKINYCFSDFPFPDDVPDFPHNAHMADYIKNYTKHFKLKDVIKFNRQVDTVKQKDGGWHVTAHTVELDEDGKYQPKEKEEYACRFVVVASGHHVTTTWPSFDGQDTFTGSKIHAVDYKDCVTNDLVDKQVVVVGIGNSAVDAAVNVAAVGRRKPVYLSTRSGAWVVPNYIFGVPVDHYACRFFLNLPWRVGTFVLEKVIALVSGHPNKWGLKPKMHALQTQPTVSPVLVSHIQRGDIKIKPNILRIEGSTVTFTDDSQVEADSLVFCTGYKMSLPFIEPQVMEKVLDPKTNQISLYKNVFSPEVGRGLAFVGFVQPASGGILSMSEMQARWFAELCKESVSLPSKADMEADIKKEQEASSGRYYQSARHTIQKDPILYCDEIAGFIGAKPQVTKFPTLAWRLWFGTNGCAQYRLQGPHPWDRAEEVVRSIPVTSFIHYGIITVVLNLIFWFLMLLHGLCDFFDLSDRWDPLEWLGLD